MQRQREAELKALEADLAATNDKLAQLKQQVCFREKNTHLNTDTNIYISLFLDS